MSEPQGISWKPLLEVAGAAAGLVLLIQIVGGAIMWARFRALELPAARGVSLLPPEYLLAVGVTAVFWSVLLGLLAVLLLYGITRALPPEVGHWASTIVLLMLEAMLLVAVLLLPISGGQRLLGVGIGLAVGVPFVLIAPSMSNLRRVSIALLLAVTVMGGGLAFVRTVGPPAQLEQASLFLADGNVTSGAYIASTSSDVYLAPDSFDRTYRQIVGIPRSEIVRIAYSKPQDFYPAGANDPSSIFGGDRDADGSVRQLEQYFAFRAGDTLWKYPPYFFDDSRRFLSAHVSEYFSNGEQRWSKRGHQVLLEKLVPEARWYSGQALITWGRVRHAVSSEVPDHPGLRTQLLTLTAPERSDGPRVLCSVLTRSKHRFPDESQVVVRGVVVAAGSLVVGSGKEVHGAFLQCTAARLLGQS